MGKNMHDEQQQEGGAGDRLSLGNHGPSCMWGILHHLQHNRWLHAKKLRLTPKHHHHHLDQGSTKTGSDDSTVVVEKKSKNSMKSRLKSLITDEIMSKRKLGGRRHQRSTSYPTRAPPDDGTPPTPTPDTTTTCEMCTTMLDLNYKNNDITAPPRQVPVRDHREESKLFMNALDLLNLRKEVFLKILHDPTSSLAHQLHRPNANAFIKSVSFPASSSFSAITDLKMGNIISSDKKTDHHNNNNKHVAELEPDNNNDNNNSKIIVLKHFKNLREKIKHVIRDRKKEKNRIIMDAVQHKIPYGGGHNNNNNNKARDYGKQAKFGKQRHHKRTSSFDESYTRYSRLLDTIISSDTAKHPTPSTNTTTSSDIAATRTPVFKRILSLPDLRAYSSIHNDDDSCCNLDNDIVSAATDQARASGVFGCDNLFDVGSTFDESVDSKTWETASSKDLNPPHLLDSDRVSEIESYDDDDDIGTMQSKTQDSEFPMDMESEHIAIEKIYSDLLQLHMGTKNEAEFNYVKDVLELSGFTRDELLGKWHSAERPMDPSVFDEVEGGSLFSRPENDEIGPYDHLLLFDLINEVLLDIHERSFCYWPVPLTFQSRIHQIPKGYRVLEEVWAEISWLLSWGPEADQSIDDAVSRDLAKHDRWMSLQMDAEFVGLEVEDMIFDDLLDEIVSIS